MSVKPPNSRRNLDLAIDRAFTGREGALRARRVMANVIVGQMMPAGVVKGGSSMKVRFGFAATRFSRDMDTARAKDIESFADELEVNLARGWAGFTGRMAPRNPATPKDVPPEYVMRPFDVKLSYNGKPWITVPLEVGHDEIGDADEPDYAIAEDVIEMFRAVGLPDPDPLPLMPLHFQIAQKLHGASEPGSKRAHDLVDLQLIVELGDVDWGKTRETCERLFDYRRKQLWPPTVTKGDGWGDLYSAAAEGLDVLGDADSAVTWANQLVARIAESAEPAEPAEP